MGADAKDFKKKAKKSAGEAAEKARPWVVWLARLGYLANGGVNILIGALALEAALGLGGATTGTRGALSYIKGEPLGRVVLVFLVIGFSGYALWRFVQAVFDTDRKGRSPKAIAVRLGSAFNGFLYLGLVVLTVKLLTGPSGSSDGGAPRYLTQRSLSFPYGRWLVAAAGLIVVAVGVGQFYMAYAAKFRNELNYAEMSGRQTRLVLIIGRLGFTARGVVFCMIGALLLRAARDFNAGEAGGVGSALHALRQEPHGPVVLAVVAVGLIVYGIHCVMMARYRRIYL